MLVPIEIMGNIESFHVKIEEAREQISMMNECTFGRPDMYQMTCKEHASIIVYNTLILAPPAVGCNAATPALLF